MNINRYINSFTLRIWGYVAALGLLIGLGSCSKSDEGDPTPTPGPTEIGKAQVWLTRGDQSKLLSRENDASITATQTTNLPVLTVQPSVQYQEVEGFGAALTGSSAYLINQRMNPTQQQNLLRDLFDPTTGIGINYLRLTMGASDFSLSDYTYNDLAAGETDPEMTRFSLGKDMDDVVPTLKQIVEIAPDIRLMGTPWSPPAWMKTNESLKGGALKTSAYDAYALYFVKYIQAMKSNGITIDAITIQNEPLHSTAGYPCMAMSAGEQKDFIKQSLGPRFQSDGVTTKVILYDHNWDNTDYAISILNDAAAKAYVTGSAFHAYGGNVIAMNTVHQAHPDRGLYFTEISGGEWATNFSDNLQWNMSNILMGTMNNWSRNALFWNLALDQGHGPKNNGCQDCRGVVTINNTSGVVTRNVEYYSLGHFSKFVRKGAHRVGTTLSGTLPDMNYVAFANADGKRVLVVSNNGTSARSFTIKEGDKQFNYFLTGKSVATLVWEP